MKLKFIISKKLDKEYAQDKKIRQYIDEQYKSSSKYLKLTRDLYQKSWDEINDEFSKYIAKTTGHEWSFKNYKCVVSTYHIGISDWHGTATIVRSWKENPYYMRRITAHELILSHYFEIIKRNYDKEGLKDGQIWALAEIAAFALTSLDPTVTKFWPWKTEYYTNHNYPWIVDIQNKLKDAFLKRKNFDEYIMEGISLVKKYPNMNPFGK